MVTSTTQEDLLCLLGKQMEILLGGKRIFLSGWANPWFDLNTIGTRKNCHIFQSASSASYI
jgi:hypothetical protein